MPRKISKNHALALKQLAKKQGKTLQQLLDERESKYKNNQAEVKQKHVLKLKKKKRIQDLIDLKRLADKQKLLRQQIKESI